VSGVVERAREFLAEDPDPETRSELLALVERAAAGEAAAVAELQDRFSAPLSFGTAGLRARVEAGLARMNRAVVMKASWGLGRHLLETPSLDAVRRGVAVGFDGRYSSRQFAEDTAAVLAGLGIPARPFPDPVPTPLLAFAVAHTGAAAGVMVTASHNPPADNGYKVYAANGAQIIPPADEDIAARIAKAPPAREILRIAPPDAARRGLRRPIEDSVEAAYLDGLARGALHPADATPLRIVYTAMHGVGHRLLARALQRAGFDGVAAVPSQCDPDGAFRTVAFPNPEEKGAMDRALQLASEVDAELVLANDPDADRLAVALQDARGGYRLLSGNEIGVLLADDALEHADTGGRRKLVVTTVVSSTLLSRMARDRGAAYAETLTGFKWIANAAIEAERRGEAFVLGYEEALGYSCGPLVRDKDGIGAALRMAELVRHLKAQGSSPLERLDALLLAHGMSQPLQWSVTLAGAAGKGRIAAAMAGLRKTPPDTIGGSAVARVIDHLERTPRADVLVFEAQDGGRLIARPSGTEPKIKFYAELLARVGSRDEVGAARAALDARGDAIKRELLARLQL
jgi:phosphomannomutase